jgi:hypothetical protein
MDFIVCAEEDCNFEVAYGPLKSSRDEESRQVVGPNPTRGKFVFPVAAARSGLATAEVFDVAGRHIATVRGRAGLPLTWDGRGQAGTVGPGIYLYRVKSGAYSAEGRVVVIK